MNPESLPGKGFLDRTSSFRSSHTEGTGDDNIHLDRLARTRLRVLDSVIEGIYQLDPEGRCTFMNRAACRSLGYRFGEALGKNIQDLHHSHPQITPEQGDGQVWTHETGEGFFPRSDGSVFPVEWSSHTVFERETYIGTVVSFRDLSERQAMESRISQSESFRTRLAAVLDAARDMVGLVMDETGQILSTSRAAEIVFGYTPSELIGQSITTLIPEYLHSLYESGWSPELGSEGLPGSSIRMRGRRRTGEPIPLEVSLGECIESGSRVIAATIRDVTERAISEEILDRQAEDLRRFERALRQQTRLVNSIVTSMGEGVIAADENGEVVLYNPAAAQLMGEQIESSVLDPRILTTVGYTVSLAEEAAPCSIDELPLTRAVRGETVDGLELFVKTAQRPQGFWINSTARPMIDDHGTLQGGVLVFRNVTEQKAAREALRRAKDEAEAANRAKSDFLSRMSHELRTPMNAILGFAQLLEDDLLAPDQRDAITRILNAGRHLLGLINDVLDISRIEAGRLNLQIGRVPILEVIQCAAELVSPQAAQRKIALLLPPSCDVPWTVETDKQALTQILVNLLGNAVKYNRDGGQVTVLLQEVPGSHLRITVADTGHGIAPDQLNKLFIPFERLGAERSGIEGTGLGLAHSNRLMSAMGGSINVTSELGKGSCFSMDIPLSQAGSAQSDQHSGNVPASAATVRNGDRSGADVGVPTVLCIQNDPTGFRDIEKLFERLPGYTVCSAEGGGAGLQRALEQPPELVLLDLELPDMDGLEVLNELRRQTSMRPFPIVVVSAGLTDETKRRVLDAGAHSCIAKPIQVSSFLDTIACLI